jgi:hypothetical protein
MRTPVLSFYGGRLQLFPDGVMKVGLRDEKSGHSIGEVTLPAGEAAEISAWLNEHLPARKD